MQRGDLMMLRQMDEGSWTYEPVPRVAIRIYGLAWQLEAWLRLFVYVELKASKVDWETQLRKSVEESLCRDKSLHHMATSHEGTFSYLTLGQLWQVIANQANWHLFEPYFPPRNNVLARVEEVRAIRNRVAHFREPHANDLARFELFLRDMEPGLRRFCLRYNGDYYPNATDVDEFHAQLEEVWDDAGYGVQLRGQNGWTYAPGDRRNQPLVNADLRIHAHPTRNAGEDSGTIYRLAIKATASTQLDWNKFLNATRRVHSRVIHIHLESDHEASVTMPKILGIPALTDLAAEVLAAGRDSVGPAVAMRRRPLESEWSEQVLWPNHPLNIFGEDITDPIIQFDDALERNRAC